MVQILVYSIVFNKEYVSSNEFSTFISETCGTSYLIIIESVLPEDVFSNEGSKTTTNDLGPKASLLTEPCCELRHHNTLVLQELSS